MGAVVRTLENRIQCGFYLSLGDKIDGGNIMSILRARLCNEN